MLEDYVDEYFPDAKRSGDERIVTCIYCGKAEKLYINIRKGQFYCFRCGAGSGATVISLVRDHLRISAKAAAQLLRSGKPVVGRTPKTYHDLFENYQRPIRQTVLPSEYEPLFPIGENEESPFRERALSYLRRRGLTEVDILFYRIGFCVDGRYRFRIIVPLLRRGEPVYFVARLFFGWGKRYLNPARGEVEENPSNLIFNWDSMKTAPVIRLAEGVFDAMILGEFAGALLGKQLHGGQRLLLETGRFKKVEIWLDADARSDAQKLAWELDGFDVPVSICRLKSGDPGSRGEVETIEEGGSLEAYLRGRSER